MVTGFFVVLMTAQAITGMVFLTSPENTGQHPDPPHTRASSNWTFTPCSNTATRYQPRTIPHLPIRFEHQAGICLYFTITGLRFLCFYRHRGIRLQVPAGFAGRNVQDHGSR